MRRAVIALLALAALAGVALIVSGGGGTAASTTLRASSAKEGSDPTINALVAGDGTATVNDSGPGASCAGVTTCDATTGDNVTLDATPGGSNTFLDWSGVSCAGQPESCSINPVLPLPDPDNETAEFTVTITAATAGAGSGTATVSDAAVGCTNAASCVVDPGNTVTLQAMPTNPATSGFTGWTGGSCGADAACSFVVPASGLTPDQTDTATFVPRYTVNAASAGTGGSVTLTSAAADKTCTAGANNSCTVNSGDSVTLTATLTSSYYHVASWSANACTGTDDTCNLPVTAAETYTATFGLAGDLNPSAAVFVAPAPNGNDANAGTEDAPVLTPNRALAIVAASKGADDQVWIADGSYPGPMTLTAADDGVAVYGNFATGTSPWTESATTPSATTVTGSPEGLIATDATASISDVNFTGVGSGAPSSSAYGVVALDGSNITLTSAVVTAGNGASGVAGLAGATGQAGGAGGAGGLGETPAQVTASCLSGKSCSASDGVGGAAGLGVNGNDFYVRDTVADKANPLVNAAVLALPLPGPGPSAGDGGLGGWGNTASGYTLQGCLGKAPNQVCGPEKKVHGKVEALGYYYGGRGSQPYDAPVTDGGSGGAPGYANDKGDGNPGVDGTAGGTGVAGATGTPGSASSPAGPTWTPGNGGSGAAGGPGGGGGGGGGRPELLHLSGRRRLGRY